jgi:hypothetical protein
MFTADRFDTVKIVHALSALDQSVNVSAQKAEVSRAFVEYVPNFMQARVGRKYSIKIL